MSLGLSSLLCGLWGLYEYGPHPLNGRRTRGSQATLPLCRRHYRPATTWATGQYVRVGVVHAAYTTIFGVS